MKKISLGFMFLCLVFSLVACNGKNTEQATSEQNTVIEEQKIFLEGESTNWKGVVTVIYKEKMFNNEKGYVTSGAIQPKNKMNLTYLKYDTKVESLDGGPGSELITKEQLREDVFGKYVYGGSNINYTWDEFEQKIRKAEITIEWKEGNGKEIKKEIITTKRRSK